VIRIEFPDGKKQEFAEGIKAGEAAAVLKEVKEAVAVKIDGKFLDLSAPLTQNGKLELVLPDSTAGLDILRHSTGHIMAEAVGHIFEGVKFAIGPAIEDGFYYDFDLEEKITEEALGKIEEEMRRIIAIGEPFQYLSLSKAEATRRMKEAGQIYKLELLSEIDEEPVSFYEQGDFLDLCRGPHLPDASRIKAFKLLSVAGSYWRGDSRNKMLQRIYGTAFYSEEELNEHLHLLEQAKARDHRRLGKELDFFSTHEEVGPGLIHWHPKGALVRNLIERFWYDQHLKRGYQIVYTPHIASERIFEISGHLDKYADLMYSPMDIDGQPYRLKPMNCPGHIMIYQFKKRSYRDLPLRLCELGTVYRYEPSGTLHGMLRVRGFTQDDAHIFCTQEQLASEVAAVLELADFMMKAFGYTYKTYLATMPDDHLGTEEEWQWSTAALRKALEERQMPYEVDEGGGVFYAPKIDIKLPDSMGRISQVSQGPTIQVDLNLPHRFNVAYVGEDGAEHPTVIVHRTVLGSMERFIGGLIEYYGGAFPLWLAPVQIKVLSIADRHNDYALKVKKGLQEKGIRAEADLRSERIAFKIREATMEKVPYMLILGDKEMEKGTVALRHRTEGDLGESALEDVIKRLLEEIEEQIPVSSA
jgi:threonyl-tRNA synthetase